MNEIEKDADKSSHQKGKNKSFGSDVLTLVGGTTFAQIFTILSAPILTRLYGPEDFGVWTLFISITSIIGIISCMRYDYAIMLPESDEDAVNLLGLSFLAVLVISSLTLPIMWCFKQPIVNLLNSPQIGNYLWFVPPFVLINGMFLALNQWNSRTRLFKRLSFSKISNSISTTVTQIGVGLVRSASKNGLIIGSFAGQSVATLVLGGQIWKDDKNLIRRSFSWKKIYEVLGRYRKFPLIDSWSAFMNTISWQLPAFFLAAFFSPSVVGFYSLGFRLLQLPMSFIGGSISQVFFQRAAKARHENTLESLVENVFRMLVIIGMFPILTLTIVGSDVFTVFFGKAWAEAGVYTQILSFWAFVWFISSPLSTIYVIMEKQQFGFRLNFFNLITRLLSLVIGGLLGNARMALILFSISGILVYGYLCIKTMHYAGVKMSKVLKMVLSNVLHFIPTGTILIVFKMIGINQSLLVFCSCIAICGYYIYILKTDMQVNRIINSFGITQKIGRING
ncbi:translocase [Methanosarcina mazei]|uniref:Translocase n=1 Tax=Methanosarcina mazei TaxID=2209 RepID=A0A0F8HNM7_METMZ|nr:lipopolysaccharide biosynthesis protein [Methanosarcina mazei]KKG79372.1 translocase [Methanosarcina mazei]